MRETHEKKEANPGRIQSLISTNWYQRIQRTAHLTERSTGAKKKRSNFQEKRNVAPTFTCRK